MRYISCDDGVRSSSDAKPTNKHAYTAKTLPIINRNILSTVERRTAHHTTHTCILYIIYKWNPIHFRNKKQQWKRGTGFLCILCSVLRWLGSFGFRCCVGMLCCGYTECTGGAATKTHTTADTYYERVLEQIYSHSCTHDSGGSSRYSTFRFKRNIKTSLRFVLL